MFNHEISVYFQRPKNKLYIVALAFGILFFLSGCRLTKSAELKAMEASVSVIQLTTGREVSRFLTDRHVALGKPVYPQVLIVYEPINTHTNKEVYDEIVAILGKNNWEEDESYIVPDFFWATLQQGSFKISATVAIDSKKNQVTIITRIY